MVERPELDLELWRVREPGEAAEIAQLRAEVGRLRQRVDQLQDEGQLIHARAWLVKLYHDFYQADAERRFLADENGRLRAAGQAVITEWDVRGDNGCSKSIQDQLRLAIGKSQPPGEVQVFCEGTE